MLVGLAAKLPAEKATNAVAVATLNKLFMIKTSIFHYGRRERRGYAGMAVSAGGIICAAQCSIELLIGNYLGNFVTVLGGGCLCASN